MNDHDDTLLEAARNLTDADVDALLDRAVERFARRVKVGIGTGFLDLLWRGALYAALAFVLWALAHSGSLAMRPALVGADAHGN